MRVARLLSWALAASVTCLASGCSDAIDVAPPADVPPAATQVCAALAERLPDTLSGNGAGNGADQESRATEPESALTAAWGDPAIVLAP